MDKTDAFPPIYLNGEKIPVVDSDKPLGNYISTDYADRHIIDNICDLYKRSNRVISDFRVCDSSTLDSLHRTYCMHMYGSELWDINCNDVKDFNPIRSWRGVDLKSPPYGFLPHAFNFGDTLLCVGVFSPINS